jgi:hypothetical protein
MENQGPFILSSGLDRYMALHTEKIPSEERPPDGRFDKLPHNELLVRPPFTMVITGSIGSGKSSILWSMLNPKTGFYAKYFDYILIFNGSVDSNEIWKINSTDDNEIDVVNKWDNEKFRDFVFKLERDQQRLREDNKQLQRICVVFDDSVSQGISNKNKINALDDLIQRCRHINTTVIIASQVYRQLNRSMRCLNTLAFIITKVNRPDLRAIAEEHCGLITIDQFEEMYREIMKTKGHPFLLINYQKPFDERFWLTFNHLIMVEPKEKDGDIVEDLDNESIQSIGDDKDDADDDPKAIASSYTGKAEPVATKKTRRSRNKS